MKIILCIFLLNITAVSVFGQSVPLDDIVGKSIEFPAAVKKNGYLMYRNVSIGDNSLRTPGIGKYSGRVQWDSCTGLFSLSGLKMEDIGEYKVRNTDQNIITVFQLNVYKDNVNVSKPHVSISQNEYPCTIECTAERGTEVTLSWYIEGEKKPYSRSSVRSAPHLDLPQTVERSGTYTCEAKNSVSNEKASITVGDHCTDPTISITWIIVASVAVVVLIVVLIAFGFVVLYHRNRSKHPTKDGETRLELSPDARRTLIQVEELLNVGLPAYDEELLNVGLPAYDDAVQAVPQSGKTRLALTPDARRTLIQVTKLLKNLDLHASGNKRLELSPNAQSLFDHENSEASGKFIHHPEATEKMTSSHETEVPSNQDTEVVEP